MASRLAQRRPVAIGPPCALKSGGAGVYLSVMIPAYNEALRIGPTLQAIGAYLQRQPYAAEVLVVDDGSTDATADRVTPFCGGVVPVRLLQHAPNRGKGYSVRQGFLHASGAYVLFTDADLSTPIGVHKQYLHLYVATYEAMVNAKRITSELIRRMCLGDLSRHTGYT
jgi:dolichyl-phosphate beta-glucosyltransferase